MRTNPFLYQIRFWTTFVWTFFGCDAYSRQRWALKRNYFPHSFIEKHIGDAFLLAVRGISQHFYTGYMACPVSSYSYRICGRYRRSEVEGLPTTPIILCVVVSVPVSRSYVTRLFEVDTDFKNVLTLKMSFLIPSLPKKW